MLTIIAALLPVFGLIALGFACGRTGFLSSGTDEVLSHFVARVTLPVLTFHVIAGSEPSDLVRPTTVVVIVGGSAIVWSLFFIFERIRGAALADANAVAFGACFGNHAFVGLPICLALIGPATMAPTAVTIALTSSVVFGWGVFMSVLGSHGRHSPTEGVKAVARQLATNPLIIGSAAGVVFATCGFTLPAPINTLLATLGNATGPCALVAIGMFVARPLVGGQNLAAFRTLIGKLLLLPLVTIGLLLLLPPLPPAWQATAILMSAAPAGSSTFILAAQTGVRPMQMAATSVVWTTVAATITIPLLILVAQAAGWLALGTP